MARTTQSKILAISSNPETIMLLLIVGELWDPEVTALHILHHKDVVTQYNNHRYFVGCDAVTSVESLALLILQVMQEPSVAGENILTILHQVLLAAPLTLLLLDNFETVWDSISGRDGVLDLLQKIGNAKHVSLMITMRGVAPLPGIAWTWFNSLHLMMPRTCF